MNAPPSHTFLCPECGVTIQVDSHMRYTILDHGCVVCRAQVTPTDFN